MPSSTSRLSLIEPIGTDPVSELRVSIAGNAVSLDAAVMITEGTLASRPAGSYVGQTYYATDTGLWYFYNGSAWETVMLAGAWTNLTLVSPIQAAGGIYYTPAARIVGDTVELSGVLYNNSASAITSGTALAELPSSAYHPASAAVIPAPGMTATYNLQVAAGGAITATGSIPAFADCALDGLSYRLS